VGGTLLWLCLLIAGSALAIVLQLVAVAALPSAEPTTVDDAAGVQTECDDIGKRLPPDVLVAMKTEELQYLESTMCPNP
jgi:hypothetical protein